MTLETGSYEASTQKRVTVWQKPDADGTEDEVWRDKFSPGGQHMGRERVTDNNGKNIKRYPVPNGFRNFPSFDHSDNFLRVKENGEPFRTPTGETVGIKPGSILVEHADGTTVLIEDEYEQYLFEQAHVKSSATVTEEPKEERE